MKLLLLLLSSLLCNTAQAQRRAVMENLATTGTSLFVSSTQTRVGVGTATPATALHVNGVITSTGMVGVTDGSNAAAGQIGELISGTLGAPQAPAASASYVAIATITLTAGDWDVWAVGAINGGATTASTQLIFAISTSNSGVDGGAGAANSQYNHYGPSEVAVPVSGFLQTPVGTRRVSVTTSTPIYLVGRMLYTVVGGAAFDVASQISARRVR